MGGILQGLISTPCPRPKLSTPCTRAAQPFSEVLKCFWSCPSVLHFTVYKAFPPILPLPCRVRWLWKSLESLDGRVSVCPWPTAGAQRISGPGPATPASMMNFQIPKAFLTKLPSSAERIIFQPHRFLILGGSESQLSSVGIRS